MVRMFAHGAMVRQIDPSWGGLVPASSPWTKAVVSAILFMGCCI